MALFAGGATCEINCEIGDDLAGQLHRRFCNRRRDDLEANLLYLANEDTSLILGSLDLLWLGEHQVVQRIRRAMARATGVEEQDIILFCTHTHSGPFVADRPFIHDAPRNDAYQERLQHRLVHAAETAVESAEPAEVGWARGEAHLGYNRRLCWADGSHTMYGDASRADFTGVEGPDDPEHLVLAVTDEGGRHVAILHNNCCHAICVEQSDFSSSDFPGEARQLIRTALDEPVPVLYLQGASGDVAPWNMTSANPRYSRSRRLHEVAHQVASETLRLLHSLSREDSPVLSHAHEDMPVGVRLPTDEDLAWAREVQQQGEEGAGRRDYVLAVDGVLALQDMYGDDPTDHVPLHVVRIGDFAMATNPCELYCQFGIDIKRRSPAGVTAIGELTDGAVGYCPTTYGVLGGGYSGRPLRWCRLDPETGYHLVDATARMLHQLWR